MSSKIDLEVRRFCKNITTLRKRHGLSRQEMAKTLKIHILTLISIECGVLPRNLGWKILLRIDDAFGISPNDMFSILL